MKKTRLKDSLRNIRKKRVSWISIVIVIMMSVGCYLGCLFYRKCLSDKCENFLKQQNFKDVELISNKGITEDEIARLREIEGVKDIEPFNFLKVAMVYGEETRNVDFVSWTNTVSVPKIVAGVKPEKEDELALSEIMAEKMKINIGDTVEISVEGEQAKYIKKSKFKVTALVDHPDYIKIRACNFVVAPDSAFDMESTNGYYLRAIIKAEYDDDVYAFSNDYFEAIKPLEDRIEAIIDDMGDKHGEDLRVKAQNELDEKKAEADKKIDEAEKEYEAGQKEYDEKLAEAEKKLSDARKEIDGYDSQLAEKEDELRAGIEKLAQAKAAATAESDNATAQIKEAYKLLDEGLAKIDEMKAKLADGQNELATAKAKLAQGKSEYESKKSEAESGIKEKKDQLDKAIAESETAKAEVDKFEQLMNDISASTGLAVPQQYYDLKSSATEMYKPVVDAMVNQQDPTEARAAADAQLDTAVDEALFGGAAPLMPFMVEMNVREFFRYAEVTYGDITVLEVLDKADALFVNGMPGADKIRAFVEAVDPNMTIKPFLGVLDISAELIGIGDARVGDFIESGVAMVKEKLKSIGMAMASVDVLKDAVSKLNEKIAEINSELDAAYAKIEEAEKQIAEGEKKISEGKAAIEEAVSKYEEGLKQAESMDELLKQKTLEAQSEFDKANKKIEDGRSQLASAKTKLSGYKSELEEKEEEYEKQKAEGEKKLKEAREKLDKKKKEAQEKIDDAQAEIDNMTPSNFVLQSRRANEGFLDANSTLGTIKAAANCFIILFIIIGVLVCFSTITIIIDEQKNLVGTQKSLGFFNSIIRSKYLIYGISAVFTGIIAGIVLSFILQFIFQKGIGKLYVVGIPNSIFMPIQALAISAAEIGVAIIATFAACHSLLKMTAVELMSGQASLKRVKKKKAKSKVGSTYSRLIRRNIANDIVRVIISVVIISASAAMIGTGFTLKFSYTGMVNNQLTEVYKYDMSVSYNSDEDEETVNKMTDIITDSGSVYSKSTYTITIYRAGDRKEYTELTILNDHSHPDYYSVKDYFTGEEMKIPDEGVLIQARLHEMTGIDAGDKIIIYNSNLDPVEVEVKGVYNNYMGRNMIMSDEAYEKIYGKAPVENTYFIHLNGADGKELQEKLKDVNPDITLSTPETVRESASFLEMIFNMIVLILTGFAILMSVFILTNITNIFVARRKKELIVMRVNGFSTKQCIGYLTRETVATTIISFILAVVVGVIVARIMIGFIETDYTMHERSISIKAWVLAICLETIFAGIIDFLAFRKVKNLKVSDITA